MPFLTIKTNAFSNDTKLVEKAANIVADVLGKPVNYVCAEIKYATSLGSVDNVLLRGGNNSFVLPKSLVLNSLQNFTDNAFGFVVHNLSPKNFEICFYKNS